MAEQIIRRDSTRHHRADRRFLDLFAEDFGIRAFYAYALEGIPMKQAIAVAQWAADHIADEEGRGEAVQAWAKKHGVGRYDRRLIDQPAPTYGGHELEGV
jgi:hypothetical protein